MPGSPAAYLFGETQTASAGGPVTTPSGGSPSHRAVVAWILILGFVLPVLLLGGLRAGKLHFVFHRP